MTQEHDENPGWYVAMCRQHVTCGAPPDNCGGYLTCTSGCADMASSGDLAGFVDASTPGYVALVIATSGLLSLGINVARYRERGVLRQLRVTPLRPGAVLVAQVAALLVATTAGVAMLLVVGKILFALRCAGRPGPLVAAFLLSCATMFTLGMALASAAATTRAAQAVGMAVFYPMIFLSGAAIPRELLPDAIQRAAVLLPLTHVVSLLHAAWTGEPLVAQLGTVAILALTTFAASAIAVRTFRWE